MFGHFSEQIFGDIYKCVEFLDLDAGQKLFKIGDEDDSFYIVQKGIRSWHGMTVAKCATCNANAHPTLTPFDISPLVQGRLDLIVRKNDDLPHDIVISHLHSGDHVTSLLSIVEQVIGVPSCYKTVEAFAGENGTRIIRIPVEGFSKVAAQHYTAFRQLTRVVALRMHRVTFVALYRFLGLGRELTPECSLACGESDEDTMKNLTSRATEEIIAGKRWARGSEKTMD